MSIHVLIATLLCSVFGGTALAAESQASYSVVYTGGSLATVKAGTALRLYFDNNTLRLVGAKSTIADISIKAITELTYGQTIHHGVGVMVALSKAKKHYIGIGWNQAGTGGGVVFQADKDSYSGLLLALEAVSGKRATDGDTLAAAGQVLVGLADYATFTFASDPSGADVLLDDKVIGRTPTKPTLIPSGRHTISARKEGFPDWIRRVTIVAGDQRSVTAELKPVRAEISGLQLP